MTELTRLEKAAVEFASLLRWGLAPSDAPQHQQCEWPYKLVSNGKWDLERLVGSLTELDNALEERGLRK